MIRRLITITSRGITGEIHFDADAQYCWSVVFTTGFRPDCGLVFDSLARAMGYVADVIVRMEY